MSLGVALDLWIVSTVTTGWVGRVGVSSVCVSVCMVCFTMYRVLCFECVVWPCRSCDSLIGTVTTSFVGHKLCFRQFWSLRVLLVLPKF